MNECELTMQKMKSDTCLRHFADLIRPLDVETYTDGCFAALRPNHVQSSRNGMC